MFSPFRIHHPAVLGDTLDYLGRGLLVIDGVEVCCQRPFVVPAAFQLLQYNTKFITDFHLLFSIVSWTILAASITTIVSHPVFKKLSFAFILFFSLSTSINQWNKALLSESITLSLTALMIACWIIYLKIPGGKPLPLLELLPFYGTSPDTQIIT